jgi:DNA mismatch endonuclease (patch repair protein)
VKTLLGSPDIVLPKWKAVVLVQGCFWHRHSGCRYATMPKTRPDFWQTKFHANVERDLHTNRVLLDAGWRIATAWECSLRQDGAQRVADGIATWLVEGSPTISFPPLA